MSQKATTVFGGKPEKLNTKPKYKFRLDENAEKEVILSFMRMQPPTLGHEKVIDKMRTLGRTNQADVRVYLSHGVDTNNNPLEYRQKMRLAKKAFGDVMYPSNAKTLLDVLEEVSKEFDFIRLVVGSDRVDRMEQVMRKYAKDFGITEWEIVNAGVRNPDSSDIRLAISGTRMRELAAKDDVIGFSEGLPLKLRYSGRAIISTLQRSMSVNEVIESGLQRRKQAARRVTTNSSKLSRGRTTKSIKKRSSADHARIADGKANSRVTMDIAREAGFKDPEYMSPAEKASMAQKASEKQDNYRKYYDQELRATKDRDNSRGFVKEQILNKYIRPVVLNEAEYQGEKVKLNKISRATDGKKKFKVFTTHPVTGNVIKVSFGDPNMEIKRDDPERRKSFRARHGCDKLTFEKDRHKPAYWSCKQWRNSEKVEG